VKVRCRKYVCQRPRELLRAETRRRQEASNSHTVKASVKRYEPCYLTARETASSSFGLKPSPTPPPLIHSFATVGKGNTRNPNKSTTTRVPPSPADAVMLRERRGGLSMTRRLIATFFLGLQPYVEPQQVAVLELIISYQTISYQFKTSLGNSKVLLVLNFYNNRPRTR
jgi:hypothetical protein